MRQLAPQIRGGDRRAENERILAEFLTKPTVSSLLLTVETAEICSVPGLRLWGS
ncbi:MAG: hypothetical protein HY748_14950 [Elusimicrobia bacterium]|nr:hypothetical protein [Elusimicrobiota bacterium]